MRQYILRTIARVVAAHISAQASCSVSLSYVGSVLIPGGAEISAFDPTTNQLFAIGPLGMFVFKVDESGSLSFVTHHYEELPENWEPTSIAADPMGRGFVSISWLPSPSDVLPGRIQFIDTRTGDLLSSVSAGYHPDCLAFTPDGNSLLVANECEPGVSDQPGALTVIDLSRISDASDLLSIPEISTYDFGELNLDTGITLDGLRISESFLSSPEIDIEPEYLAPSNEGVWVSLQENNALAYFNLISRRWSRISPLQPISMSFDGSDSDGIRITSHAGFLMMPQPDTIASFNIAGHDYLILANEGESGDSDMARLSKAMEMGMLDEALVDKLHTNYTAHEINNLMNLRISLIDGDLDHDGDLDQLMISGARGFAIHDASDGIQLWNSGSQFERITSQRWPEQFNSNDSRSDQSGPEPEGIATGKYGTRTLAFIGLERADAVFMYDISDPISPVFLDAVSLGDSCGRPEGLTYFVIHDQPFLSVSSEQGGCLTIYHIEDLIKDSTQE